MSEGETPKKVGYCNPPSEHRFQPGASGNLKGRPLKEERAYTPRQLRRDIVRLAESMTRVRTAEGEKNVTLIEAIFLRLVQKALAGHGPSMRRFIDLYSRSIDEHYEVHKDHFDFVELVERDDVISPVPSESAKDQKLFINRLRKRTQRI